MTNKDKDTDSSVPNLIALDWKLFPVHGINAEGTCTCGKAHTDKSAGNHPVYSKWNTPGISLVVLLDYSLLAHNSWNVGVNCKASGFLVMDKVQNAHT